MSLSFIFNLIQITFNLIVLWCLLAYEWFTILLLIHPFARKTPTSPTVTPKRSTVGVHKPQGVLQSLQSCSVWGFFVGFFPLQTHMLSRLCSYC